MPRLIPRPRYDTIDERIELATSPGGPFAARDEVSVITKMLHLQARLLSSTDKARPWHCDTHVVIAQLVVTSPDIATTILVGKKKFGPFVGPWCMKSPDRQEPIVVPSHTGFVIVAGNLSKVDIPDAVLYARFFVQQSKEVA